MTRTNWPAFLVCLVLAVGGCNTAGDPHSMSVVLEGDPATRAVLEQILKENPQLAIPDMDTEYSMIVIKPDPSVDYKILKVTPDPTIDYQILIIDPRSGNEQADLSRQLGDVLREKLRQQQKESKE